jgi:hypothetical protein
MLRHYVSQQCQYALVCLQNRALNVDNKIGPERRGHFLWCRRELISELCWTFVYNTDLYWQAATLPRCVYSWFKLSLFKFKIFVGFGGKLVHLLRFWGSVSPCIGKWGLLKNVVEWCSSPQSLMKLFSFRHSDKFRLKRFRFSCVVTEVTSHGWKRNLTYSGYVLLIFLRLFGPDKLQLFHFFLFKFSRS